MATTPSLLRSAMQHHRTTLAILLIGLPLVCWVWIVTMARDMYGPMTGSSAWMMTASWDLPYFLLTWAMWAAMMAAMMLPSAAPFVLLHAFAADRSTRLTAGHVHALVYGYVLVWAVFSLAATTMQWLLGRSQLLTPMLEPANVGLTAGLLLLAGLYQWTSLKHACLRSCRSPLSHLTTPRREGLSGAFTMGVDHGVCCLGCCWILMLLLFAGGVMSLAVIVTLTALVALEKLAPFGAQSAKVSGALLVVAAAWVYVR